MALSALIQWEVRPTNGTANAGGGFVAGASGTDRSQQNAVQTAFTDLVLATTTTLTSAANPFGATDVGNVLAITGGVGFTTGLYEIVSVAVVTATIDRAGGTGGSTGGTGNLGGARLGFAGGTTTLQASLVAGNKVWVKNEAWNEAVALSVAGAAGNPIVVEGYNTARGDAPIAATRPLLNRAAAAGDGITISTTNYIIKYLMATAAGDAGFSLSAAGNRIEFCKSYSNTGEGFENGGGSRNVMIGCEANLNGVGIGSSWKGPLIGCYSHDNTGAGLAATGFEINPSFCIFEANGSHGISNPGDGSSINNCTVDANTGASTDGVNFVTPTAGMLFVSNILANNGRYGANATDGDSIYANYNDYFGNATAARLNVPVGANDVTTNPTFTDAANGNFAIGTNLKALGWPGIFPGALSQGYLDIGAVQRQEAGAAGMLFIPDLAGT